MQGKALERVVSLSFDVDWASDEVIADTVEVLERFGAKATFFATHDSKLLRGLDPDRYELGIHPNFNPLLEGKADKSFREVIDDLLATFPSARGIRSHSLATSAPMLAYAASRGLRYESNMLLPVQVAPYRDYDALVRVPVYWCDYREMLVSRDFAERVVPLAADMPAVFLFHPIHVFLNSDCDARYVDAKPKFHDVAALRACRNEIAGTPGVRDCLVNLLSRCERERLETVRMIDLVDRVP